MKLPKDEKEYLELVKKIREHDRHYYDEARPKISDYEYDQLVEALLGYELAHPEKTRPDSPSKKIAEAPTEGFTQKEHLMPMMSLNNTYSEEELKDFIKRVYKLLERQDISFCSELKMDGSSLSLRYEKGRLISAVTRGNGRVGDDVTKNIKTIKELPLELKGKSFPEVFEVRAEVYMSLSSFFSINEKREEAGLEPFANPRNAAAGSLKMLDPKEVKKRELKLLAYGAAASHPLVKTQFEMHQLLKEMGLPVAEKSQIAVCKNAEEILLFAHKILEKRKELPFEIDGIVVKVNELKFHEQLGATGKAPRYAVAYKFAPEQAETIVREITVQVGRSGVLTPVAELEPVLVSGSRISRASLHNQEEIARKDVRVGDTVVVEKAGEIIPQVVRVVLEKRKPHAKRWKMPDHCPICKEGTIQLEGEVAVRCANGGCLAQRLRKIIYFASKGAMDIEHLGEKVAEMLVEKGLVSRVSDIYLLDEKKLEKLDGFKEKSIHNLLESIASSKKCPLSRFIMALGIPHVGSGAAEILAEAAGSLDVLMEMSIEEFQDLEGVGAKTAEAIYGFLQDQDQIDEIHLLLAHGVHPYHKKTKKVMGHPFSGKTFVLTGTLSGYTRSEAASKIKERGGKVSGSISKNTDFLLAGDEPGSKYEKAEKLRVTILTEKEFQDLL